MSHVIPTGMGVDSRYLFAHMTARTLAAARAAPGVRILDVASGAGNDARALAGAGARVVGVEPSSRMLGLARLCEEKQPASAPRARFVQAWGDVLPFADGVFDAALCKGSLDHFDRPGEAIAEMARVTRSDGRVVLAIANYESAGCRLARGLDALREGWLGVPLRPGRRMYDVPSDHFTRYDPALARVHAEAALVLERVEGLSLGWGFPGWARLLARLPERVAFAAVQGLDAWARRLPALADVLIVVGGPRRSASTSR